MHAVAHPGTCRPNRVVSTQRQGSGSVSPDATGAAVVAGQTVEAILANVKVTETRVAVGGRVTIGRALASAGAGGAVAAGRSARTGRAGRARRAKVSGHAGRAAEDGANDDTHRNTSRHREFTANQRLEVQFAGHEHAPVTVHLWTRQHSATCAACPLSQSRETVRRSGTGIEHRVVRSRPRGCRRRG